MVSYLTVLSSAAAKLYRRAFDNLLGTIVSEVKESLIAQKDLVEHGTNISFAQSYAPYSYMGEIVRRTLSGNGLSEKKIMQLIRTDKSLIDTKF